MWKQAIKTKLRIGTDRGQVLPEDLYDIPLEGNQGFNLDELAISLRDKVKSSSKKSFVSKVKKADAELELAFSLVKEVITDKLEEKELLVNKAENAKKKQAILKVIAEKEN